MNISKEVWVEDLEKLADGTYKRKNHIAKARNGVTFDEHLAEYANKSIQWDAKIDNSQKGQPGGIATLDGSGRITSEQLPPTQLEGTYKERTVEMARGDIYTKRIPLSIEATKGKALVGGDAGVGTIVFDTVKGNSRSVGASGLSTLKPYMGIDGELLTITRTSGNSIVTKIRSMYIENNDLVVVFFNQNGAATIKVDIYWEVR